MCLALISRVQSYALNARNVVWNIFDLVGRSCAAYTAAAYSTVTCTHPAELRPDLHARSHAMSLCAVSHAVQRRLLLKVNSVAAGSVRGPQQHRPLCGPVWSPGCSAAELPSERSSRAHSIQIQTTVALRLVVWSLTPNQGWLLIEALHETASSSTWVCLLVKEFQMMCKCSMCVLVHHSVCLLTDKGQRFIQHQPLGMTVMRKISVSNVVVMVLKVT